jgi:hypothetical protein
VKTSVQGFFTYDGVVDRASRTPPKLRRVDPQKDRAAAYTRWTVQFYDDGKFRIETIEPNPGFIRDSAEVETWDGVVSKSLDYPSLQGKISSVTRTEGGNFAGYSYLGLFRNFDGNYTYLEFFRDRLPDGVTTYREGSLQVIKAVSIRGRLIKGSPFTVIMKLNPDKGLMPEVIEKYYSDESSPRSRTSVTLKEVIPGVWAPTTISATYYNSAKGTPFYGDKALVRISEIDLDSSSFNCRIDPSEFDIVFPKGVLVGDDIHNTSYRVGQENARSYLDHLSITGRLGAQELRDAKTQIQRKPFEILTLRNLVFINGLLILTYFLYRAIRKVVKRRAA